MTDSQIAKGIEKDKNTIYLSRFYYKLPNGRTISVIRCEDVQTEESCKKELIRLVKEALGEIQC